MHRRGFLSNLLKVGLVTTWPTTALSFTPNPGHSPQNFKFGLVADVHKDLMPDADDRLRQFIREANQRQVDFLVQLGDFCMGLPQNKDFMGIWETFKGSKYHVLGNHDMDKNSKAEMVDYWEMPGSYYSWDYQGVHFVVLDANFLYKDGAYIDYERANFYVDDSYRTFIDPRQIEWFESDLAATKLPTIVFSHQSLWHYQWGVKNRLLIQKIMEVHADKIICCMNGHDHIDFHHHQNGIDYFEINSMSYQWMSDQYRSTKRFAPKYYQEYKSLPNIAPYKDPLYAFVTVDTSGKVIIEGVRSEWVSPSPHEMGMPVRVYGSQCTPEISDYEVAF